MSLPLVYRTGSGPDVMPFDRAQAVQRDVEGQLKPEATQI